MRNKIKHNRLIKNLKLFCIVFTGMSAITFLLIVVAPKSEGLTGRALLEVPGLAPVPESFKQK